MGRRAWLKVRGWWLLPAAAAAGASVAAAITLVLPERYQAESTLALTGDSATRELQLTYTQLLTSDEYLAEIAPAIGLSTAELGDGLRAVPSPGTILIGVFVTAGDEAAAIERSNAVSSGFGDYLADSGIADADTVVVTQAASSASRGSDLVANVLLGGAVGLVGAAAILTFAAGRLREKSPAAIDSAAGDEYKAVDLG